MSATRQSGRRLVAADQRDLEAELVQPVRRATSRSADAADQRTERRLDGRAEPGDHAPRCSPGRRCATSSPARARRPPRRPGRARRSRSARRPCARPCRPGRRRAWQTRPSAIDCAGSAAASPAPGPAAPPRDVHFVGGQRSPGSGSLPIAGCVRRAGDARVGRAAPLGVERPGEIAPPRAQERVPPAGATCADEGGPTRSTDTRGPSAAPGGLDSRVAARGRAIRRDHAAGVAVEEQPRQGRVLAVRRLQPTRAPPGAAPASARRTGGAGPRHVPPRSPSSGAARSRCPHARRRWCACCRWRGRGTPGRRVALA